MTETLLIVAVMSGFAFSYTRHTWGKSIIMRIGCALGWIVAFATAYLRNTTKLIDTGMWNIYTTLTYLAGLILFVLVLVAPLRKLAGKAGDVVQQLGLAAMLVGLTGYMARDAFEYPFDIMLAVTNYMSTDFFFRLVGWLFGFVLMYLVAYGTLKVVCALDRKVAIVACLVGGIATEVYLGGLGLRAMITKRLIAQNKLLMKIAVFASNSNLLFSCIMAGLALACVVLLVRKALSANEPYSNPAQHRKIRAKWRSRKRWAAVCIVCLVLSLLNVTAVKAYESREVELSPSEDCELRDDGCYIPFEQVDDGHLHRFTYTSDKGVGIRFIIIKKPSGNSYGIGLDACDICGETGYYERDGNQVVCKLCDVVMNVQTIGFKGGCNPIVIDYDIQGGYIHVPYDTLLEHEDIFTR